MRGARRRAARRRQRRAIARRPRRARARPQRARHLRDAARARRVHRGQAVLDRLSHRASAVADRPRALRRRSAGHPLLGAADYKLVHHARNGRSVYSFCMCPGGTVVAATSEPGRVVTNGMSQYSRNERNANAGIVVGIAPRGLSRGRRARPARSARSTASPSSATGSRAPSSSAAATTRRRASASATSSRGRASTAFGACCRRTQPGVRLTDLARRRGACPTTRSRRSAKRCRRSSARSRASRCPTRC